MVYKNTTNMTEEDFEEFKKNPNQWFVKELKAALLHDPLLLKCYRVFQEIRQVDDPFSTLEFLTMALYQALLSNSVTQKQLMQMAANSTRIVK